ncbi:MAG: hypothetical protein A2293_12490 [Elusimicrobia bacterium RIFOXYB2_FULL_49_7]|nr:MAG: hypothetical protein A2293_12490 [Elusimicrobia bacterium RIFOXYB2_FULL_49_7]
MHIRNRIPLYLLLLCLSSYANTGRFSLYVGGEYAAISDRVYASSKGNEASAKTPDFSTGGLDLGTFIRLNNWLSLKTGLSFGTGEQEGDLWPHLTLQNEAGEEESHDIRLTYNHSFISFAPELITFLPSPVPSARIRPFLALGGGVASYTVKQTATIEDTSEWNGRPVTLSEDTKKEKTCFLASVGGGLKFTLLSNFFLLAQYRFKYWKPIEYTDRILPDLSFKYWDIQRCHVFKGDLLIGF